MRRYLVKCFVNCTLNKTEFKQLFQVFLRGAFWLSSGALIKISKHAHVGKYVTSRMWSLKNAEGSHIKKQVVLAAVADAFYMKD